MLFCIMMDMLLAQPYIYMYCFTLFVVATGSRHQKSALNALRIMVSGVYFWAGFHKLNATFYASVFPWFFSPVYTFSHADSFGGLDIVMGIIMLGVPLFESMIGVLLLFPKYRKIATAMAFTMLVTVLICLGPFGHNWGIGVWPWNIFLFLLEVRLFLKLKDTALAVLDRHWLTITAMILPVSALYSAWGNKYWL